jgi:hypothetical protein
MRWRDGFVALLGITCGIGAMVLWADGVSVGAVSPLIGLSVIVLLVAMWRWMRAPRVLLVSDHPHQDGYELRAEMDEAGFAIRSCPGPTDERPCPVHLGLPCPFREPAGRRPVAAVIRHHPGAAVPPCGPALRIPVVRVEDQDVPTTFSNGAAEVGASHPADAAGATRKLVAWRREALTPR